MPKLPCTCKNKTQRTQNGKGLKHSDVDILYYIGISTVGVQ